MPLSNFQQPNFQQTKFNPLESMLAGIAGREQNKENERRAIQGQQLQQINQQTIDSGQFKQEQLQNEVATKRGFEVVQQLKQASDRGEWQKVLELSNQMQQISPKFAAGSAEIAEKLQNMDFDAATQQINDTFDFGVQNGLIGMKPHADGGFSNLIKDFTPEEQRSAKMVKAGLKGRKVSNAILSAIDSGEINNLKDARAAIKQAESFADKTGISRANTIDEGFESIKKIAAGVKNIDRALLAVRGGAGVGAVQKLWPSIRAASVELDNVRGNMALDVVGATTFGALSKGELDLAKDIALPTGLDTPELIKHLEAKKIAQGKLRAYYNEQIQFLDQGGTVAGFLRSKQRQQGGQSNQLPQGVTEDDISTTMQVHGMTREQVLSKLGGG